MPCQLLLLLLLIILGAWLLYSPNPSTIPFVHHIQLLPTRWRRSKHSQLANTLACAAGLLFLSLSRSLPFPSLHCCLSLRLCRPLLLLRCCFLGLGDFVGMRHCISFA